MFDKLKEKYKQLMTVSVPQTLAGIASSPTLNRVAQGINKIPPQTSSLMGPVGSLINPQQRQQFGQASQNVRTAGIRLSDYGSQLGTKGNILQQFVGQQVARPIQYTGYGLQDIGLLGQIAAKPSTFTKAPLATKESFTDPNKLSKTSIALSLMSLKPTSGIRGTGGAIKAIDKGAILENVDAQKVAKFLNKMRSNISLTIKESDEVTDLAKRYKIKPIRTSLAENPNINILQQLEGLLNKNQQFAYEDLSMGIVGKPTQPKGVDTQAGLYDQPIKVYHGTNAPIKSISEVKPGDVVKPGMGNSKFTYVSENPEIAKAYSKTLPNGQVLNGKLEGKILDAPKGLDYLDFEVNPKLADKYTKQGYSAIRFPNPEEGVKGSQTQLLILDNTKLKSNVAQQPLSAPKGVPTQASKGVEPIKIQQPQIKPKQISPLKVQSEVLKSPKAATPLIQKATLKQSKQPMAEALPDIISRASIDLKSKVGWHDAIRTPDRVMKKIGMEKEMNLIRQKYDDYLRELPQEIDKVTAWSKQVPKESNQRIFKYLDGQPVQLEKNELKVANEIKWRVRSSPTIWRPKGLFALAA